MVCGEDQPQYIRVVGIISQFKVGVAVSVRVGGRRRTRTRTRTRTTRKERKKDTVRYDKETGT